MLQIAAYRAANTDWGVYAAHQQVIGSINVQMPPSVTE
jgi:hypothetical protein